MTEFSPLPSLGINTEPGCADACSACGFSFSGDVEEGASFREHESITIEIGTSARLIGLPPSLTPATFRGMFRVRSIRGAPP